MVNEFEPEPRDIYSWWNSLDPPLKEVIIEQVYPNGCDDVDETWKSLDWFIKLKLYEENSVGS